LLIPVIAGSFMIAGVLLKMIYDAIVARREGKRADREHLSSERRDVYEHFLQSLRRERHYWSELHKLQEAHARGEEVPQERLDAFPASPMGELVDALEAIRRVARTYQVITSAESVVRLFADMAAASRAAITTPGPNDEITWFLLQRFSEDREKEFVFAYREDLGIGRPKGGPRHYPRPKRPRPADQSESILRAVMSAERGKETDAANHPRHSPG
jgi:hypothetical protein